MNFQHITKNILLLPTLLLFSFVLKAQKADSGKVELVQDEKIPQMVQKYTDSQSGKIKGYRVQIFFGAEKNKAKDQKSKFLSKYSDVKAYEIFETPYFKIRAGNFRTKLEAYQFLQKIKDDFPGAFIVEDEIELPELWEQFGISIHEFRKNWIS